jgi:PAS domain S-box-containing protein
MKRRTSGTRPPAVVDYREIFEFLPVACAVLHKRVIVDCNDPFADLWRTRRTELRGKSFGLLYAAEGDFDLRGQKIGPILALHGTYSDDWLMKRYDGSVFWCQVSGMTLDRSAPYDRAIWTFSDLSVAPSVSSPIPASLTPRERQVATLLVEGRSSKEIGRALAISPRTVHIHRANLLRKYGVDNTADLLENLVKY